MKRGGGGERGKSDFQARAPARQRAELHCPGSRSHDTGAQEVTPNRPSSGTAAKIPSAWTRRREKRMERTGEEGEVEEAEKRGARFNSGGAMRSVTSLIEVRWLSVRRGAK